MKFNMIDLKAARARVDAMNDVDRVMGRPVAEEQSLRSCILTCRGALEVAILDKNWDYVEDVFVMLDRSGV